MGHHKTGSDKTYWATPQPLFDKLNQEFKFTLDACATKQTAKCELYFSPEDNALQQPWRGRVFMNPPYGRGIEQWVRKACEEIANLNCAFIVGLLPVRSDAQWWHRYVLEKADEVRFTVGRVGYLDPANGKRGRANITFGSAIVVWKSHVECPECGTRLWVSSFPLPHGSSRKP